MIQLAFYRASAGTWLDYAIDRLSGGLGFSHVELVISDGWSFSSTSRDRSIYRDGHPKRTGTRWKWIDYSAHPERWVIVPFDPYAIVTEAAELRMVRFADDELDCLYDWRGVVRMAPGMGWLGQSPTRWFCSEVVIAMIQRVGFLCGLNAWEFSPNSLARLLGVV
jgi:hypothetical protein